MKNRTGIFMISNLPRNMDTAKEDGNLRGTVINAIATLVSS